MEYFSPPSTSWSPCMSNFSSELTILFLCLQIQIFTFFFFLIEINRVYTNLTVLSTVTHICLLFSMISEGDETTQRHMHLCVYTRKKMMPCRGFWTQRGIFTELHSGAEVSGDWSSYKIYENKQWEGGQRGREWKQVH